MTTPHKPFPHGIDITAPGGLDRLFSLHFDTFGDAVMKAAVPATDPVVPAVDPAKPADEPAVPSSTTDPALKDAGQRALAAERNRADEAERKLREREQADMSELDRAKAVAADEKTRADKLTADNLRLTAIADAEVAIPKKYHVLIKGSTEAELAESITAVTELIKGAAVTPVVEGTSTVGVVPGAGTGGGTGNNGAGGSMAAGADRYAARKAKQ